MATESQDMNKAVSKLLAEYGEKATIALKRQVRVQKLVATGKTVESIVYKVKGTNVRISFDATLNILDKGIKANKNVKVSAILQWMKDKNIRPRDSRRSLSDSSRGGFIGGGSDSRNMKVSAWLIARSISRKGTIKRFGYQGAKVIKVVRRGSNSMNKLTKDLKKLGVEQIKTSFNQLKK